MAGLRAILVGDAWARAHALGCVPRRHAGAAVATVPGNAFWSWGGWVLGFVTALLGPQGIWACTAAVEAAVHRHLDDQLFFLANRDHDLHGIILAIREEELAHLHHAEEQLKSPGPALNFLRSLISIATDVLIWLSTWGDSSRMTRALKAAKKN